MSIVHMDNFTIYGGVKAYLLNGVYAEVNSDLAVDPDGISSGWVAWIGQGTGASIIRGYRFVLPSLQDKVGQALRMWFPALPTGSDGVPCPLMWRDVSNTDLFCITVDSTGRISARTGSYDGAIVATTTNPVITANGWYHIEGLLDIDTDTFELRVEGVTVLDLSGFSVANQVAQVYIGTRSTNTSAVRTFYAKDYVIYDGSGSYNNDFIGSVLVHNLLPTADVDLNWTPSTGTTGYEILDDIPPDDGVYLSAPNPPPSPYVCEVEDLPPDVTSVKAIMTMVRAAKTDGGDASLQIGVISDPSGTPATALGADRPITVAQTYWRDVFETDPATTAPWLPSAVDEINLQMDRTA